jgi:outer membrane cobalamin receptor
MIRKSFLLIALVIFTQIFAVADDKKKSAEEAVDFVERIVVTGEAIEETSTVTVITAEEMAERRVTTVAQALESVPGSHLRVGAKGEAYIRLRGFRQREAALLVDGIPISSPYHGQLDLNSLPVAAIDRIEIVKGASSLMYGANAMGGVINIITKKSNGKPNYSFSGEMGSGQTNRLATTIQGGLKKMRYMLSGGYFNQDHFSLSKKYEFERNQNSIERSNSDQKLMNADASLAYDFNEKSTFTLHFSHVNQERGLPPHDNDQKAKFQRMTAWNQGVIDAIFDFKLPFGTFKAKFYYDYMKNVLDTFDDNKFSTQDQKNSVTDTMNNYALGGDIFYRKNVTDQFLVKSALRFRYDKNENQLDTGEPFEYFSFNTVSIPLEMEWQLVKLFTVTGGASSDWMYFEQELNGETKTNWTLNPQLACLFEPQAQWKFKIALSGKTRFPTMKELFSPDSGNTDLDPMQAKIFEVGGKWEPLHRLSFSATYFYNDVNDLITRLKKDGPYENVSHAVFNGFELGMEWLDYEFAAVRLSYTYLNTEDKSGTDVEYIEYRPKHKIDGSLLVMLPAKFRAGLNASYISSQFYFENQQEQTLDPCLVMDMKVSKKIIDAIELMITVQNVFDVNYFESAGYPREGRMVFAGVMVNL